MELSNIIYCYLHMEGKLVKGGDVSVEYKGGKREGLAIDRSMTYQDFIAKACEKMKIEEGVATFSYTLEFDLFVLQPMRIDEDFMNMVDFINHFVCVCVYIYIYIYIYRSHI